MKYKMVIHVSRESREERAALALLDSRLAQALGPPHVVHDHDLGRSHLKVIVRTDDPTAAFECARSVLSEQILQHTSAFYSEIGSRREQWLWPPLDPDTDDE